MYILRRVVPLDFRGKQAEVESADMLAALFLSEQMEYWTAEAAETVDNLNIVAGKKVVASAIQLLDYNLNQIEPVV